MHGTERDGSLENQVAVVTGGGGGIGGAICRRLVRAGAVVAVCDRDEATATATAAAIGRNAKAYQFDIADRAAVISNVERIGTELGPIDILINNAAFDIYGRFLETDPDRWRLLIDINVMGALNMHHAVLPGMVTKKSGSIINMASDAARVGGFGEAVYSTCKSGLIGLTKALAREHARDGIRLNVVCPGPTDTPLLTSVVSGHREPEKLRENFRRNIPMGRIGVPDDLAGIVAFLAGAEASFITGQVISVSGGLTMAG
ncbi:MAG: SDR family oxidoreductase [Mesorhizobium sp.]|nr:SDR family oxidoreductase [Mesorhizobium sp.]